MLLLSLTVCVLLATGGSAAAKASATATDPRLIIVGGTNRADSVSSLTETFPPSSSLSIPPLPEIRYSHSLTLLPGSPSTLVVCGGETTRWSCLSYAGGQGGWQEYASLKQERRNHCAARLGDAILVIGGVDGRKPTAELVPGGGEFDLQHDSFAACAIRVEDAGEVVLIGGGGFSWIRHGGGSPTHGHVSRYSSTGFLGSLPDLRQKRRFHACGAFTTSRGEKMLLVTGGIYRPWISDGSSLLSSTELLSLTSPTAWTPAANLPQAMYLHSVASLPGGELYLAGGHDGGNRDEVLRYDQEDDIWEQVGKMADEKYLFAMVGADLLAFT